MTIEIANRLVELRKQNGLSQEELADKLGISRQAVSKWERSEASPDTDNLICLAELYGMSLDELLYGKKESETVEAEKVEKEGETINIKFPGGHIKINDKDDDADDEDDDDDDDEKFEKRLSQREIERNKKIRIANAIASGSLLLVVAALYVTLGLLFDGIWPAPLVWQVGWVLFLLVPMVGGIFKAVEHRKLSNLLISVIMLVVIAYVIVGMFTAAWHPTWVVFLLIPASAIAFGAVDKANADKRHAKKQAE